MKKTISFILSVMLVFCVVPSVSASSGACGDNLTWNYDETTKALTIEGTGAMYDEFEEGLPWADFVYNIQTVNIGDGVTSVYYDTFYDMTSLETVTVGSGMEEFSESLFDTCESLLNINVSAENEYFSSTDGVLFDNCNTLVLCPAAKSGVYTIPEGTEIIGSYAFELCNKLTQINIPASVTDSNSGAFNYCDLLTAIKVSENNANFSSSNGILFNEEKTQLIQYPGGKEGEYSIPNTVKSIGDSAFFYCTSLTKVVIPNSVTSIADNAFYGCSSLTEVVIPNSVTSVSSCAFEACYSLASITIPDSVTSIGMYAFSGTAYYEDTSNWENGVLYIGNYLIKADSDISSECTVKVGTKVIANSAFDWCLSLTKVTIPDSVTCIGESAFEYCDSLTDVYYSGGESDWNNISIGDWNFSLTDATIHYNYEIVQPTTTTTTTTTTKPTTTTTTTKATTTTTTTKPTTTTKLTTTTTTTKATTTTTTKPTTTTTTTKATTTTTTKPTTTTTTTKATTTTTKSTTTTTTTKPTTTTTTTKPTTTTTTTQSTLIRGDANGDGKVSSLDILALKRHVAYQTSKASADLTGDGKVTSTDILLLKRIIANAEV